MVAFKEKMLTTEIRKSSVNLTLFLYFQAVNSASFEIFQKEKMSLAVELKMSSNVARGLGRKRKWSLVSSNLVQTVVAF